MIPSNDEEIFNDPNLGKNQGTHTHTQKKANIKINIKNPLKIIMLFGKKKEKELLGSNHTKKLKI